MELPPPPPPQEQRGRKPAPKPGSASAPPSLLADAFTELRQPKSHHLVVCGAPDPVDGGMFADFLGLCTYLTKSGFTGDFISCFPLGKHFDYLTTFGIASVIEFGHFQGTDKTIVYYSKYEYEHKERFFRKVSPADLRQVVLDWIDRASNRAQSGDSVDIWIMCHGSRSQGLQLGNLFLDSGVLQNMTNHFRPNVQLNMCFSACYSGQFADKFREEGKASSYIHTSASNNQYAWSMPHSGSNRYRNGRFTQALFLSLAGMNIPADQHQSWTIARHENFIKDSVKRRVSPPGKASDPQFYHGDVTLLDKVQDVLFRSQVDVNYDRTHFARRARTEWPTYDMSITDQTLPNASSSLDYRPSEGCRAAAMNFLDEAASGAVGMPGFRFDELVVRVAARKYKFDDHYLNKVMSGVYYRARIQSTMLDILYVLHTRGHFDPLEAFTEPIFAHPFESNASHLAGMLSCFKFPGLSELETVQTEVLRSCADGFLDFALYWLAIVILRGQTSTSMDFGQYLHEIELTDFLGPLDQERFTEYSRQVGKLDVKHNPSLGNTGTHRFTEIAGWFLPDDIPLPRFKDFERTYELWSSRHAAVFKKFNDIEKAYKAFFALDDTKLLLEEDQIKRFEEDAKPFQIA